MLYYLVDFTFFVAVNFGIILVPLGISLYYETRFTDKRAMVGYGLAAMLFSALFYFDPNTAAPTFDQPKSLAFLIFVPYGLLSIFVAWLYKKNDWDENQATLPFSGKYFAALQMPFSWAQLVAIPGIVWSTETSSIIQWGIVAVLVIMFLHIGIFLTKNDRLKIPSFR